jgi:competence protein ComEA
MKYRLPLMAAAAVVAGCVLLRPGLRPPPAPIATLAPPTETHRARPFRPGREASVVVYVAGAVAHPGLYRLSGGSRYDDAVRDAGGLLATADPAGVNLAAHAQDGDEILVPALGESIRRATSHRTRSPRRRKASIPTQAVDLNSADATTLETIPGIGATLATRIVAVRQRDGAFTALEQLLDVAGMSQGRLDRAQPFLRI